MPAPVSLAFRIAANLTEMRANLAEARQQLETTKASMKAMANGLDGSKLLADANAMIKVVTDLGGAGRLTETNQKRVNATLNEAIEQYRAMGKEAPAAMRELAEATKQVQPPTEKIGLAAKTFGELTTQVKATALGFVSGQAIISTVQGAFHTLTDFVGDSVQSYANAEAAAKKMTVALQTQGNATPGVIGQFNDLSAQFQQTTVYSDDLINEMEALLTQVGNVAPTQMQRALQASADLASGLGIDLNNATMLVAKAFAGGGDELGRLKAILGEAYKPGMDMAGVLDAIQSKFGGQAAAEAETYAGKIKQIANAWDNVKEAVGRNIVEDPVLTAVLRQVKEAADGTAASGNLASAAWEAFFASVPQWVSSLRDLHTDLTAIAEAENTIAAATAKMNAIAATSPVKTGAAFSFSALDAKAKQAIDETIAAWKKEDEAAKQHAAALETLFQRFSGGAATSQIKDLDSVFRRLAASGQLTEDQIAAIVKEALHLQDAGGKVTPRLWDMVQATNALSPGLNTAALDFGKLGTRVEVVIPVIASAAAEMNKAMTITSTETKGIFGGTSIPMPNVDALVAKAKALTTDWTFAFGMIGKGFDQLASSSTGGLSRIAGSIGDVTNALLQVSSIMTKGGPKGGASHAGTGGILTPLFDADATSSEKWAAAVSGGLTAVSGAMSVWSDTASAGTKSAGAFTGAMSGAKAGAAFGPYGAAIGAVAGAVAGMIHAMSAGRREVEAFAKSFDTAAVGSGFDELQKKMLALGDDYERLWKKLTQQTGKGDKKGAQAVIAEIQDALSNTPEALGFKTTAQLQEVAEKARSVYEYMVKSGQYAASEIAKAFEASATAQKALFGDTAQAQKDAIDAISAKYSDSISKLESEYKSLSDSVAGEAAEEFMGITETHQRERMKQIEGEKAAQQIMRDAEIAAKQETFDATLEAGQRTYEELRRLFAQGLDIPSRFIPPAGAPGGDYGYAPSGAPTYTGGRDSGLRAGSSGMVASGGGDTHITLVMPDGDVLLRQVVRSGKRKGWM